MTSSPPTPHINLCFFVCESRKTRARTEMSIHVKNPQQFNSEKKGNQREARKKNPNIPSQLFLFFYFTLLPLNNPNLKCCISRHLKAAQKAGVLQSFVLKGSSFTPRALKRRLVNYYSHSDRGWRRHKERAGGQNVLKNEHVLKQ